MQVVPPLKENFITHIHGLLGFSFGETSEHKPKFFEFFNINSSAKMPAYR